MKIIWLSKGQFTLVDDEDYERLSRFKWYARKSKNTFYATRRLGKHGDHIQMHRDIVGINEYPKLFADHEDHNGLNNQRDNLRVATRSQNNANKKAIGVSIYLGVFYNKQCVNKPWYSRIRKNKKTRHLGYFANEMEAAIAYNNAAIKIHGEFANLNAIEPGTNIYSAAS